jgi:hypothetical protein
LFLASRKGGWRAIVDRGWLSSTTVSSSSAGGAGLEGRKIILSKYLECQTVLGDRKFLVAALTELGYHVEVHPEGTALFGYEGHERPERAHVIIRRKELSPASNDIGFARSAEGRFVALLSEYDQQIGYDRKWLAKVQQIYKEKQTIATARAKGYIFQGREVVETASGQQIRLRFGVR